MLNGISEKGSIGKHNVQVIDIPWPTSEVEYRKLNILWRFDSSIIYVGKNNITTGANLFNNVNIIVTEIQETFPTCNWNFQVWY